jgi:hypothetical protein
MRSVILIMIWVMGLSPAVAAQIVDDGGGLILTYVERFTQARDSGERIVVDGPCLSACTLLLAFIPEERICVTPKASFGFHAAWSRDAAGGTAVNSEATESMLTMYPQRIREWIRKNGGLGQKMIYLRGRQLAALYPACLPGVDRSGLAERAHTPMYELGHAKRAGRSFSEVQSTRMGERSAAIAFSRSHVGRRHSHIGPRHGP